MVMGGSSCHDVRSCYVSDESAAIPTAISEHLMMPILVKT
jgi:hypothetical protein